MGLRFDKERAIPRKPYYANLDSTLRRQMQAGTVILPMLQQNSEEENMARYEELEGDLVPDVVSSSRIYGNHTKIREITWNQYDAASNFTYEINFNGFVFETGTETGQVIDRSIVTTDFKGKVLENSDYFEIVCTRTAGANPGATIKIKGWNS